MRFAWTKLTYISGEVWEATSTFNDPKQFLQWVSKQAEVRSPEQPKSFPASAAYWDEEEKKWVEYWVDPLIRELRLKRKDTLIPTLIEEPLFR